MAFNCPHCSVAIDGAMTKEAHLERLKAKDEENKAVKAQLSEAQGKVSSAEAIKAEHAQYKAELAKRDQQAERATAFQSVQIPDAVRSGFEIVYASEMAGVDAPVPFAEWLTKEETKSNPMLSVHYGKPTTATTTTQTTTAATVTTPKTKPAMGGLTNTDANAGDPPVKPGIQTPQELQDYLRSPAYRSLPKDQREQTLATLKAQFPG